MTMKARRHEAGFSLVELLIAMLVTMVVSGAVFTLLNAGQGAFRREPELTDRQQNIRLAMDLIQRDIAMAGSGMDPWEQAFSMADGPGETGTLLDGFNNLGTGPSGRPWDVFETMGGDSSCNDVPATPAAIASSTVNAAFAIPSCFPGQPPLLGTGSGLAAVRFTAPVGNDSVFWGLTGPNTGTSVSFPAGQPVKSDVAFKGGIDGQTAASVVPIQIARYQILADAQGVPNLWRSGRGGLDPAGALTLVGDATGGWQLIARGIEDLQVRYRMDGAAPLGSQAAACCGSPVPVVFGTPGTVVKEVEVTLWARTMAPNLQGQTARGGVDAIHGSLVTISTPRAALMTLHGVTPKRWR
jgi:type II secretory pathway pseudopilin PulG